MEKKPWYKDKVFDQIWLRFFTDGNYTEYNKSASPRRKP